MAGAPIAQDAVAGNQALDVVNVDFGSVTPRRLMEARDIWTLCEAFPHRRKELLSMSL